jgi:sucrose-6-phosphate hydrolase SacC (GH32 family)
VLISCPQGVAPQGEDYRNLYQCGWLAGHFDGAQFEHGAFHELDRGFEFYAPQTTQDNQGRRLLFAWLGLPEENEMSQPTVEHGWIHQMSCPRELVWQDEWLCQRPVAELDALKGEQTRFEGAPGELPTLAIDSAWLDLALSGEGRLGFGAVAELVQTMLIAGDIDMGHARALLSLDKAEQITTANQVAARKLSVRETEALVKKVAAGDDGRSPSARSAAAKSGDVLRVEEELSDLLMAQVQVRLKKSGKQHTGEVAIAFGSLEALNGLIERLRQCP